MEDNTLYIIKKALRRTLGKSILSVILQGLTYSATSIIVAHLLGIEEMSIMLLAVPLWIIFDVVYDSAAATAVTLYGDALSKSDKPLAIRVVSECFWSALLIGIAVVAVGMMLAPQITAMFGIPDNMAAQTEEYIFWLFPTVMLAYMPWILVSIISTDGAFNRVLKGYTIYLVATIGLTVLFISTFGMGLLGYLWAAALSSLILVAYSLGHFNSRDYFIRLILCRPSLRVFRKIVNNLIYYIIDYVGVAVVMIIINRMLLENFSLELVAIFLLLTSIDRYIIVPIFDGVTIAATPLYSVFYGDRNYSGVYLACKTALKYALVITSALLAVIVLFAPMILKLFNYEYVEYVDIATLAIRVYCLCVPLVIVNGVINELFIYIEKTTLAAIFSVTTNMVGPLTMLAVVLYTGNIDYLWFIYGASAVMTIVIVLTLLKLHYKSIRLERVIGEKNEQIKSVHYMLHTNRLSDLEEYQEMTSLFFEVNGVDERRTMLCNLALGEIVEYAIASDQKDGSYILAQISILEDGDVRLSVKLDNSIMNVDTIDADDEQFLSLRMLRNVAKDFAFKRVFTFNSLEIVI